MSSTQTMKNRDILSSGASIAGPTLASWLRRYGFNPTIVERAPELREGGQAIDVLGTGSSNDSDPVNQRSRDEWQTREHVLGDGRQLE